MLNLCFNQYATALKIDHLITQYLYQQKKLNLPGIGTFTMENGGVAFSNTNDPILSPDLVEFIHTHTGKMTSLAIADLESFIMLNKQFLNIGKALHFEGIGTLVKAKEGQFEFTPGEMVTERIDEKPSEHRRTTLYESADRYPAEPGSGRKWLVFLGIAATLGIIIWGGWKWSEKNAANKSIATESVVQPVTPTPVPITDSLPDTTRSMKPTMPIDSATTSTPTNFYKFVILQTNRKNRALARYQQLKELRKDIRMETADSIEYKLFFLLQVQPKDTIRTRDSLSRFYDSRVRVE